MMGNYHVRFGMRSWALRSIDSKDLFPTSLIITAHAFVMIFFMVNYNNLTGMIMEKNLFLSNFKTIFNSIFNWFDLFIIYFSIEASAVIQEHKKKKN